MKKILSNNIKKIRESRGFTFYGLSKITGIHQETLKRMERGQGNVKAVDVKKLSDFYKVNIEYFFTKRR